MIDRRPNKLLWSVIIGLVVFNGYQYMRINKLNERIEDQTTNPMIQPPALEDNQSLSEISSNMNTMYGLIGKMMQIMNQVQELNENPELKAKMKEAAVIYHTLKKEDDSIDTVLEKKSPQKHLLVKKPAKEKTFLQNADPYVQGEAPVVKPKKKPKPVAKKEAAPQAAPSESPPPAAPAENN